MYRVVLISDFSARILNFAFREIDSQIMIVLWFRGSENCHSCIFDFSVSSPYWYLIRSGRPSRIQWTHQPIRNENQFTREFCMHGDSFRIPEITAGRILAAGDRDSTAARAPPRSRAPATRAHTAHPQSDSRSTHGTD